MIGLSLGLWQNRPSFSPLSLSPALWLDASDSTTLFQSNGGAAASADGDPVGYCMDKSGNAKHGLQSDGTKKPALKLSSLNGKNGIESDGVNDVLQCALNMNGWSAVTLIYVGKPLNATGLLVANYSTAGGIFTTTGLTSVNFGGRPRGGAYVNASSSYASSTAPRILTGRYDGTNVSVKNNQGSVVSATASIPGAIISQPQVDIFANTHASSASWGAGILYELIVLNYYATTEQVQSVLNYLNSKWAVY